MKLSNSLINKIVDLTCSKTEINFIVYIAQFQLLDGFVPNIYYKEIIQKLNINQVTFYRVLHKLKCKNIITFSNDKGYYNIKLKDNDFSNGFDDQNYVNINREFLLNEGFFNMKATSKYTLLKLLLRNTDRMNVIKASNNTIAKYANIDNKNKRLITKIVENMKNIFDVFIEVRKNNVINFFRLLNNSRIDRSEAETWQKHMLVGWINKNKIKYKSKDILDLIQMYNQYDWISEIYCNIVKEILLYYGSVECKIIRSKIDVVANRMSLKIIKTSKLMPLY